MKGVKFKRALPTILTVVSAVGVAATTVLAVKVTPKAIKLIEEKKERETADKLTLVETAKTVWKCYIPTAAVGVSTICCIFGSNALSKKQMAAAVSAYAMAAAAYKDRYQSYARKNQELNGDEAHKKVLEALAVEKSEKKPIYAQALFENTNMDFQDAGEEERLFYDYFSDRYFHATISQVLLAEYHLNRNFALGGAVSLNDFYDFLGVEKTEYGETVGWSMYDGAITWLDFNHVKTVLDDGLECYIIEMAFAPDDQYLNDI